MNRNIYDPPEWMDEQERLRRGANVNSLKSLNAKSLLFYAQQPPQHVCLLGDINKKMKKKIYKILAIDVTFGAANIQVTLLVVVRVKRVIKNYYSVAYCKVFIGPLYREEILEGWLCMQGVLF